MDHFSPSPERASELRDAMAVSLLESACIAIEEIRPGSQIVPGTPGTPFPDARPLDYGAYFDLALPAQLPAADRKRIAAEAVDALLCRLGKPAQAGDGIVVSTLAQPYFSAAQIERLCRWWDADADNAIGLTPVSDAELANARNLVAAALCHLAAAEPELHGEIVGTIRDIVVARPDGVRRKSFGACTSFALWGGFVVDFTASANWLLMLRTIVHEAAHNLLFAKARTEPLVANNPEERFPSPVRRDPRPMDGVFHAGFVSARECLALDRLLSWHEDTGKLGEDDARFALRLLEISTLNFHDCAATICEHGRLTPLGEAIFADCEAYMAANFALAA